MTFSILLTGIQSLFLKYLQEYLKNSDAVKHVLNCALKWLKGFLNNYVPGWKYLSSTVLKKLTHPPAEHAADSLLGVLKAGLCKIVDFGTAAVQQIAASPVLTITATCGILVIGQFRINACVP